MLELQEFKARISTKAPDEWTMAQSRLISLDRPDLPPFPISERLRSQLVYFQAGPQARDMPKLGENELWFDRAEVSRWLMDGVFYLISPLDTEKAAEVELTDEQDALLTWLEFNHVRHVRIEE